MKNPTPFYAVCSNVITGQPEYIRITDAFKNIDYIRASASLPYFSRIVDIGSQKYLDGGCTDSIPLSAFKEMGYEKNVAILTRDIEYRKKPEMKLLSKAFYSKYPKFCDALLKRHEMYNKQVEYMIEQEKSGNVFVIRPQTPLDIGRMETNPDKIQLVYDRGRTDASNKLSDLVSWLNSLV